MRVAIFEPEPRICGPVTWTRHLKAGFDDIGVECDIVTFTKSGRTKKYWGDDLEKPLGCGWSVVAPQRVERHRDAVAVLNEYDLVILTEPKNATQDKEAIRNGGLPYYVDWLANTTAQWTTALHGPQYDPKRAPFLPDLFRVAGHNFTGHGISHGYLPGWDFVATDETGTLSDFTWETSPLPFKLNPDVELRLPEYSGVNTVGISGRCTPNKGHQLVGMLPAIMDVDAVLWGAASKGLGANFTYIIWENLAKAGAVQEWRDGPDKHTPLNPFPWRVRWPDGQTTTYRGNYETNEIMDTMDVHVNLTSPAFSGGLVEFSTLEAIDAGKPIIVNENVYDDRLTAETVNIVPPSVERLARGEAKAMADLWRLCRAIDSTLFNFTALHHNRRVVEHFNHPGRIARKFLA